MNLTGGGAFYSQTPKSCLEDLGEIKGSFSKGAGAKHLRILKGDVILNGVKNRRNGHKCLTQRFFEQSSQNDKIKSPLPPFNKGGKIASIVRNLSRSDVGFENTLCHSERSEGLQSLANIVSKKILNYPTSTLPCNARPSQTRGAEVQDDISCYPRPLWERVWVRGTQPAFTLAEILITLGVIGIIAAMTLPMLARNYNFYIRQQQFKKAYAALNIAVQKTQIDLGEGVKCSYSYKYNTSGNDISYSWSDCNYFYNELAKNLQVIKTCEKNALSKKCVSENLQGGEVVYINSQSKEDYQEAKTYFNSYCTGFGGDYIKKLNSVYVVNSGFYFMPFQWSNKNQIPLFMVDINGQKGPNKWGYDVFIFEFYKQRKYDSVFRVNASVRCHPLEKGGYYTTTFMEYLYGRSSEL